MAIPPTSISAHHSHPSSHSMLHNVNCWENIITETKNNICSVILCCSRGHLLLLCSAVLDMDKVYYKHIQLKNTKRCSCFYSLHLSLVPTTMYGTFLANTSFFNLFLQTAINRVYNQSQKPESW